MNFLSHITNIANQSQMSVNSAPIAISVTVTNLKYVLANNRRCMRVFRIPHMDTHTSISRICS